MDLAAALRDEARRTNERRLLVLAGAQPACRERAETALETADVDPSETTYVGTDETTPWEQLDLRRSDQLLGTTRTAIVLDCHDATRPNSIGQAVGAVDGGGLLVLLTPPLATWPDRRDDFDAGLAVPPFEPADVAGHFRSRLVSLIEAHPGVAILDVDDDTVVSDGLTDPAPRYGTGEPAPPPTHEFPADVYDACRTTDQVAAVQACEALGAEESAVVLEADRGRGKSSAAGLAAAALALDGADVLVTAPAFRNARELFARARELHSELDTNREQRRDGDGTADGSGDGPSELDFGTGRVRFREPAEAVALPAEPDVVLVDEAAALPVRRLQAFLEATAVCFATTIHGYEGAGRGFSVRFRDDLEASRHEVTTQTLETPIRYAGADPVEVWGFRALGLDAGTPAVQLIEDATPETVTYRQLSPEDLLANENLLREVFGLLVLAHYRTEPNDLARLLDAPNVAVHALTHAGHVVAAALVAREGDLPADLRASMYEGARVRGNMLPDVLTSQLRDEAAGVPVGYRVMRIATHHAVRSRGLGSQLLDAIANAADDADWLGVGFGATPGLLSFWADNGYGTVHLSTTRNDRSGEYSAIMLDPQSESGRDLFERHTDWFSDRVLGMLGDPLADADPDVVRATLGSVDADFDPSLSAFQWRVLAGVGHGAAIFDSAPDATRRLALAYFVASSAPDALTGRQERLLVRKALQAQPWDEVAAELDYHSRSECMRDLGQAVDSIVATRGPAWVQAERERLE